MQFPEGLENTPFKNHYFLILTTFFFPSKIFLTFIQFFTYYSVKKNFGVIRNLKEIKFYEKSLSKFLKFFLKCTL